MSSREAGIYLSFSSNWLGSSTLSSFPHPWHFSLISNATHPAFSFQKKHGQESPVKGGLLPDVGNRTSLRVTTGKPQSSSMCDAMVCLQAARPMSVGTSGFWSKYSSLNNHSPTANYVTGTVDVSVSKTDEKNPSFQGTYVLGALLTFLKLPLRRKKGTFQDCTSRRPKE